MRRLRRTAVASAIVLVAPVVQASSVVAAPAHAVITWDLKAETAIYDIAQQAPPQVAGRSFAMVSGAVYDAVNAIAGKPYQPYLKAPRAGGNESTDAAVATAATQVLIALFPDQLERLRADYAVWLAAIPTAARNRAESEWASRPPPR
jgi:hypothetical protein